MQEEIFLPVDQSGRERSIIEVLDEMMASLELPFSQKRAAQLKIKKGKITLIAGLSGSGKTTLLRHLKKELMPKGERSGQILYDGQELEQLENLRSVKEIGYLFQDPSAQMVMDTVWHEIAFGLENLGMPYEQMKRTVAEIVNYFDLQKILRKPKFTYENKKVSELLIEMKQSTFNLAIVMDEYGEFSGIVTLEDIIEEIVGDVQDEYDAHEEENIVKLNNQTYDVKGYLSLHDLNDYLDLDLDSEDFDSVGGLVIDALGRLPQTNDETTLPNGIRIKVLKVEKNRIESVRLILPDTLTQKDV